MTGQGYFNLASLFVCVGNRVTKLSLTGLTIIAMQKLSYLLFLGLLLSACSKDNTVNDQGPVIKLATPSDQQVFTAGQTVMVAGSFTDLDNIRQTQIHVSNKSSNAEVLHVEGQPNAVSATLNGSFTAAAGITYKIELEAIDIAGNESKLEVTVSGK
jgi:hypothetical protein